MEVLIDCFGCMEIDKNNDVLYDLGCGDGRCVMYAAETFGIRCVGVEIDPERALATLAEVKAKGLDHLVEIRCGNALEIEDLEKATIVFLFLIERGLRRIYPQLVQSRTSHSLQIVTYLYRFDPSSIQPTLKKFCSIPDTGASFPFYHYRLEKKHHNQK